jgi:hypothetical protein
MPLKMGAFAAGPLCGDHLYYFYFLHSWANVWANIFGDGPLEERDIALQPAPPGTNHTVRRRHIRGEAHP